MGNVDDNDIWTKVEVNRESLAKELASDSSAALKKLAKKMASGDLEILLESVQPSSIIIDKALDDMLASKPDKVLDIYCLLNFLKYKKHAVSETARAHFGTDSEEMSSTRSDLILLHLLFKRDSNLLMEVYIRHMVSLKSFNRLKLESETKSRSDFDFADLNRVNTLLMEADRLISDNRKSHCWFILKRIEKRELYIRREEEEVFIPQLYNNMRANLAKSIILQFGKYARTVGLWEERGSDAGRVLLDCICEELFDKKSKYKPVTEENAAADVERFLGALIYGTDENLILRRIEMKKSLLRGNPAIVFSSTDSVAPAMNQLNELEIRLSDDFTTHTRRIKFIYDNLEFWLVISKVDDYVLLKTQYLRGANGRANTLDEYLIQEYGISLSLGRE